MYKRTNLYQAPAPPDSFAATEAWLSGTLLAQPGRSTAGGVPQGSPISGLLANVFLTAFDRALERARIVFLRSLDDVTILATSPAALAAGLGAAKSLLESLGMSLWDAVDPVKRPAQS